MSIKKLDNIIASRIAAGEVVERPASALRELLDNSIDAGADEIEVYLEEGGNKSLMVKDNGSGFEKDDLPLACLSHATSKISTLDDLYALKTLGFRGEALCSISACSKTTIKSNGWQITVDNGIQGNVIPSSVEKGSAVLMEDLFENLPARKQFLKRPSSETQECRKVFLEKALGFENVSFKFFADGTLGASFAATTKHQRALDVMSCDKDFVKSDTLEMHFEAEPVALYAVASKPFMYKRDRSQIRILVNNRVVDCYPLVQAITNAYSVALPGGGFPYFTLYITDSPSLIDFNIHPTKRECKIRNQSTVHSLITMMIRDSLLALSKSSARETVAPAEPVLFDKKPVSSTTVSSYKPQTSSVKEKLNPSWFETAKKVLSNAKPVVKTEEKPQPKYRYVGQIFDTFLVAETEDKVLFIDQHAAHERILYDRLVANPDRQNLMVPYRFETDRSTDDFLNENSVVYQDFGVDLVKVAPMVWEIVSLPAVCRKSEKEIADYIQKAPGDVDEARKGLFAVIACHSAIKANDKLDDYTAINLLDKVFELDAMLCPHGRSFVFAISKEQLFKEVGRIV